MSNLLIVESKNDKIFIQSVINYLNYNIEIDTPICIDDVDLVWHPRVLWVGIGCQRGTPKQLIETAIEQTLKANHLAIGSIAGIATIDTKAGEVGLVELCAEKNWPLRTFPAQILSSVTVPHPSAVAKTEVGTPSVAEAAALLASENGNLLVPKQIFRFDSEGNSIENRPSAVTIAICLRHPDANAQSKREYIDRT